MIRRTILYLKDIKQNKYYNILTVIENILDDMQDYNPSMSRKCFLDRDRDDAPFRTGLLIEDIDTDILPQAPMDEITIYGMPLYFLNDSFMQYPSGNPLGKLFLELEKKELITLPDILPKRKCSFRLKGFFDPNSQMLKELLQLKGLLPKLSYLTKKHLGYDIMEYTSHIGNVYILHNNEIFRNIDFRVSEKPNGLHMQMKFRKPYVDSLKVRITQYDNESNIITETDTVIDCRSANIFIPLPFFSLQVGIKIFNNDGELIWMNKRVFFLGKEFSYETFSSKEIELEKSESDGSKRTVTVTKIALNGKKRRKSNKKLKDNLADDESRCLAELNEKHMEFVFFSADTNQNKENKEKAREYVMQLLNSAENECLICDPYFKKEDFEKYIFFMEKLDVKVRIINSEKQLGNISAPDSEDYLLKLNDCINYYNRKVGREVAECRSLTKNLSIHDRFIIIDDCGWLIGSSLNEFGNRASSICKIPQGSLEYMRKNFERWWNDTENSESLDGYIQRKVKLNASPEGKLLKHITHLTRVLNSLKSQLAK